MQESDLLERPVGTVDVSVCPRILVIHYTVYGKVCELLQRRLLLNFSCEPYFERASVVLIYLQKLLDVCPKYFSITLLPRRKYVNKSDKHTSVRDVRVYKKIRK